MIPSDDEFKEIDAENLGEESLADAVEEIVTKEETATETQSTVTVQPVQFASFEDAQNQMIDEMKERCSIPQDTFDKWNGSLMVEDEYGNWAFWSDGGYRKSKYAPIDWQIVEVEV